MNYSPFEVKDCNLALIVTGETAESLFALKDLLYKISPSSLYYHFWGERLRVSFVHPEYHNDFAKWVHNGLHDNILTERLSIIDPTEYSDIEDLRKKVIDVVENRLEELEFMLWSRKDYKFHFLRSIIIIFDGNIKASGPNDLKSIIPNLTLSSIFFHFIDARRRTAEGLDDFSTWLKVFGTQYDDLIQKIKLIDCYFLSLSEIRQKLAQLFSEYL